MTTVEAVRELAVGAWRMCVPEKVARAHDARALATRRTSDPRPGVSGAHEPPHARVRPAG